MTMPPIPCVYCAKITQPPAVSIPKCTSRFMAMKREVLRLGGYRREFFVSQTPELTQMADVVIDLASGGRNEAGAEKGPAVTLRP